MAFHELSPDEFRRETAASWPRPSSTMLLVAWKAAVGHPAYVTTAVADLAGGPARSFRDWVAAHATPRAFVSCIVERISDVGPRVDTNRVRLTKAEIAQAGPGPWPKLPGDGL